VNGFTDLDVPDQTGRCVIVTGANTGIGFEEARALAASGARVLLGCRDPGKGEEAVSRILATVPDADCAVLPLDLADLDSIRHAAAIASAEPRVDVLLNNAGVMYPPLTRTRQGFELQFGVNHLGPFAFTALMLPKLAEAGGARVVVTSSLAHTRGEIPWDDLNAKHRYRRTQRYSDSKLANMLFFSELDQRLRKAAIPVSAIGCHPGVAATELSRHSGLMRPLFPIAGLFLNSPAMAAWPGLQAATDPLASPGGYYGPQGMGGARGPSGPARRSDAARDADAARRLWEASVAMTGIDPGLPTVDGWSGIALT
jgi:NAD(P)-dependent dehydrogenase (short-subunit alcohol dehydrogenase family)